MGQERAKLTKQWADKPFPLLETPARRLEKAGKKILEGNAGGAVRAANEMALVHNTFIRVLNCIYLQAPNVKNPKDIDDFTIFMSSWVAGLHEHHGTEEEFAFPLLEKTLGMPGYMEVNVDQHHQFESGVNKFDDYIVALKEGKETFDAVKVRELIDGFGAVLAQHLADEVDFIADMEKFNDKIEWAVWNKKFTDYAVAKADTEFVVPLFVTNLDKTFEAPLHTSYWPPFPWFVSIMFRWLYVPKRKGAWRFSCCDDHSIPKDLEFV